MLLEDNFDDGMCVGYPNTTFGCPPLNGNEGKFTVVRNFFEISLLAQDTVEVWQLKEPEYTYEIEKLEKKKGNKKSVLEDDGNFEKVIGGLLGHHFSDEQKVPNVQDKDKEEK